MIDLESLICDEACAECQTIFFRGADRFAAVACECGDTIDICIECVGRHSVSGHRSRTDAEEAFLQRRVLDMIQKWPHRCESQGYVAELCRLHDGIRFESQETADIVPYSFDEVASP